MLGRDEKGNKGCKNDDWVCMKYTGPTSSYSACTGVCDDNKDALKDFAGDDIGGFSVLYDDSLDREEYQIIDPEDETLKIDTYYICFFNKELKAERLIQTSTCNLKVDKLKNSLRKTELIRGDVLYTYEVVQDASFEVRDCTI
jgi:hypothetical protein